MTDSAPSDPPIVPILLPPSVVDQLTQENSPAIVTLSPNLTEPIIARLVEGSPYAERLWQVRTAIIKHLESGAPGWGPWPSNSKDVLAVGIMLGFWVQAQADLLIEEASEEQLAPIEEACRREGKSLEQYLIDRIVESKEDEEY